ncbi:hypothetical protein I551_8561 [Mycobacterium ulcerans str. Harvey]|uniref:Uncharacterized protein n=1 Tax=Mycobacterium ulcerans str. Harvey TaxID=1299332 RepID=A0ABN0RB04_MYCUL|nr:hypothetical protein I551_8561 [Mycobacterium ulcerans str. Harvey]
MVTAASNMTVVTMPGGHSTASRRQWPGGGPLLGPSDFSPLRRLTLKFRD